jgi:RNA polymerase sigma-70 factor (ECF subfamily)
VDAFAVLVARHQVAALRVAYSLVGPEAEDVVQEAMTKAYRNLDRFRADGSFRAWVLRIVANEASNRRRAAGRRAALALRVAAQPAAAVDLSPEDAAVAGERRRRLVAALATLSDADRLVLAYRWFAELTEAEMADALGCRPGTVKSRLSRALGRLRAALPEFEGAPGAAAVRAADLPGRAP